MYRCILLTNEVMLCSSKLKNQMCVWLTYPVTAYTTNSLDFATNPTVVFVCLPSQLFIIKFISLQEVGDQLYTCTYTQCKQGLLLTWPLYICMLNCIYNFKIARRDITGISSPVLAAFLHHWTWMVIFAVYVVYLVNISLENWSINANWLTFNLANRMIFIVWLKLIL